jgi:hypothetical protein
VVFKGSRIKIKAKTAKLMRLEAFIAGNLKVFKMPAAQKNVNTFEHQVLYG